MYGGLCAGPFLQGCLLFSRLAQSVNLQTRWSFLYNESLITRARNALVDKFMQTDSTHLLFVDADIQFSGTDVMSMLAFSDECPILCGAYPKKEINWQGAHAAAIGGMPADKIKEFAGSFVINLVDYVRSQTIAGMRPVEVWNGGTGFMLIQRSVFEKMKDHVPSYVNGLDNTKRIFEYFATSIEPGTDRLLSEDFHFCYAWRQLGGKVYAAPWLKLGHLGSYLFEGQMVIQEPAKPTEPSSEKVFRLMPRFSPKRQSFKEPEGDALKQG